MAGNGGALITSPRVNSTILWTPEGVQQAVLDAAALRVGASLEGPTALRPQPGNPHEEILLAAQLIMQPGSVHELRILNAGREGTISGYFTDPVTLAKAATELDATGRYEAIYITLNPCRPDLLARANNRVRTRAKSTTSGDDITRRVWLLIDCDPKRPAGISSTDAEHGRAISTACGVWDDLRGIGFGDPVVCDSGNGAHLLYRIDLLNTGEATALIRRTLRGIARHCEPDDVSIDLSVFDPNRIVKLHGTMARKGDPILGRPHRRSRILEIPERMQALQLENT